MLAHTKILPAAVWKWVKACEAESNYHTQDGVTEEFQSFVVILAETAMGKCAIQ